MCNILTCCTPARWLKWRNAQFDGLCSSLWTMLQRISCCSSNVARSSWGHRFIDVHTTRFSKESQFVYYSTCLPQWLAGYLLIFSCLPTHFLCLVLFWFGCDSLVDWVVSSMAPIHVFVCENIQICFTKCYKSILNVNIIFSLSKQIVGSV